MNTISDNQNSSEILDNIIITGEEKVKKLLSQFNTDDYDTSKNFKINLHIHSTISDGKMSPLEILKQANEKANQLPKNEKFTFALTDHDTTEGTKIIANEIKKNPQNYQKLNFITGIELSTHYFDPNFSTRPVELDFLIYGFAPNNQELSELAIQRQTYLQTQTEKLFCELNTIYNTDISIQAMKQKTPRKILKNMVSNGYLKFLLEYLHQNYLQKQIDSEEVITALIQKHFENIKFPYKANIDLIRSLELSKDLNAFCSIAHPGRFNFTHAGLKTSPLTLADEIISKFLEFGGNGIESNYMSYREDNEIFWNFIQYDIKKFNFQYTPTGGYDSHGDSIATRS